MHIGHHVRALCTGLNVVDEKLMEVVDEIGQFT